LDFQKPGFSKTGIDEEDNGREAGRFLKKQREI
jgi:hypothetical protein